MERFLRTSLERAEYLHYMGKREKANRLLRQIIHHAVKETSDVNKR